MDRTNGFLDIHTNILLPSGQFWALKQALESIQDATLKFECTDLDQKFLDQNFYSMCVSALTNATLKSFKFFKSANTDSIVELDENGRLFINNTELKYVDVTEQTNNRLSLTNCRREVLEVNFSNITACVRAHVRVAY